MRQELNELYRLIENNADIKNKIKLIGIGAGNSSYEVEVFKKNIYCSPFPFFQIKTLRSIRLAEK